MQGELRGRSAGRESAATLIEVGPKLIDQVRAGAGTWLPSRGRRLRAMCQVPGLKELKTSYKQSWSEVWSQRQKPVFLLTPDSRSRLFLFLVTHSHPVFRIAAAPASKSCSLRHLRRRGFSSERARNSSPSGRIIPGESLACQLDASGASLERALRSAAPSPSTPLPVTGPQSRNLSAMLLVDASTSNRRAGRARPCRASRRAAGEHVRVVAVGECHDGARLLWLRVASHHLAPASAIPRLSCTDNTPAAATRQEGARVQFYGKWCEPLHRREESADVMMASFLTQSHRLAGAKSAR